MKTVEELYEEYRIMPELRKHQLRVAAVVQTMCDNLTRDVDAESAVLAALFHDMGNIIKSNLTIFPEFLEPEGQAHWELVKEEFIRDYGAVSHDANVKIARRIGLSERVQDLIDGIGFGRMREVLDGDDLELQVLEYSDLRVGPHGILSLEARLEEGKWRYEYNHPGKTRHATEWEELRRYALEIEKRLFAEMDISPEDITEAALQPLTEELRGHLVP